MKNGALIISGWLGCRKRSSILLVLAWVLSSCGSNSTSSPGNPSPTPLVTVSIDQSHQFQTVEGFGAEMSLWNANGHRCPQPQPDKVPDSDKTKILDDLYSDLGLTGMRTFVEFQGPGGDFDRFLPLAPIYAQIQTRLAASGDHLAYNFVAVVTPAFRNWLGRLASDGAARYADWAANGLTTLKNQYGIVVNHWGIVNEPDGVGNITPSELKQLVSATGAAFQSAGLATTIAVPQTVVVRRVTGYATPILSDPSTRQYVSQLDYHEYDYDASRGQSPDITERHAVRDLAKQYGLTVAQRETSTDVKHNQNTFWDGTYDQAMAWANDLMTDMVEANAAAWDLILAKYPRTDRIGLSSYIVMNLTNCVYQSFDIPPHYWTLRQFVKFVRQGAVRIAASSSSGDVRAVAFTDSKRQQTIIVAINNNATTNLRVAFTGTPSGSATVSTVTQASVNNASQGQSGAQTSQVTAQNGQFTVTLLARSLTTFVFGP